jgi:hypothetical protein
MHLAAVELVAVLLPETQLLPLGNALEVGSFPDRTISKFRP